MDVFGVAGFAKVCPEASGAGGGARVYKRDSARTGLELKSILTRPSSGNVSVILVLQQQIVDLERWCPSPLRHRTTVVEFPIPGLRHK